MMCTMCYTIVPMRPSRSTMFLTRLIAYVVITYGLIIILDALTRQLHVHHGRKLDLLLVTVPQIAGLGFMYLGTLLLRRKYNAWVAAMTLFAVTLIIDIWHMILTSHAYRGSDSDLRLALPLLLMLMLWLTRDAFKVKSDMRTFQQALWVSALVLGVAFLYGIAGFLLLDDHDFHHEIGLLSAAHLTIDQFGLTTNHPIAYTRRARLFLEARGALLEGGGQVLPRYVAEPKLPHHGLGHEPLDVDAGAAAGGEPQRRETVCLLLSATRR